MHHEHRRSYRAAQRAGAPRLTGIARLFQLAGCGTATGGVVLDVLGGDGVLARAWEALSRRRPARPAVLTGDISGRMVRAALDAGLPAVRQAAQQLLVRDAAVDAVILAYGTHHIPETDRERAFGEAARVLKPGGRLVVHDFEEGSAVARWFREVVHEYTSAGHDHPHFTRHGLAGLLDECGFRGAAVHRVYDPFRLSGRTRDAALTALLDHLTDMYGLCPARARPGAGRQWIHDLVMRYFRITTYRQGDVFVAELPRVALAAVGTKWW